MNTFNGFENISVFVQFWTGNACVYHSQSVLYASIHLGLYAYLPRVDVENVQKIMVEAGVA
jgi:hypothetical protein